VVWLMTVVEFQWIVRSLDVEVEVVGEEPQPETTRARRTAAETVDFTERWISAIGRFKVFRCRYRCTCRERSSLRPALMEGLQSQ
jgi:hypothetical protein